MNTISNYQSLNNWYTQSSSQNAVTSHKRQNDGVREVGQQKGDNKPGNKVEDVLENLVTDGTITEEQENSIKTAIQNAIQSSAYTRYKIQSTSDDSISVNPLESLVESGTITQEQADAVKNALDEDMKERQGQPPPPPSEGSNPMADILESLVSDGIITEDQLSAIENAFEDSMKSNSMPPPPPAEESNSMADILESLVTDETITEEQQSMISSVFQSAIQAYETQFDAAKNFYNTNTTEISL